MSSYLIKISEKSLQFGWKKIVLEEGVVWFKGYIYGLTTQELAIALFKIFSNKQKNYDFLITNFLKSLVGDFAFIIDSNKFCIAVVDNIASIPIFFKYENSNLILTDSILEISKEGSIKNDSFSKDSAVSIMMSGYTVGGNTLNNKIFKLTPFEYIFSMNEKTNKASYSSFFPKTCSSYSFSELKEKMYDCLVEVMTDTYESIKDKNIVVLLSGGGDSRLIASLLKHIGADNITCLSYGMDGSDEVKISRMVADKLGYKYIFIPLNKNKVKKYFYSKEFTDYYSFSDAYSSVPYISEAYQISSYFRVSNASPKETVFINGNTGDFINGSHIPEQSRKWQSTDNVLDYVYDKHYSMWEFMKSDVNKEKIKKLLLDDLALTISNSSSSDYESIYEVIEYYGRQSHLIVTNQRTYDFFGSEWRMPLWDQRYIEFWSNVGSENRVNSKLYKQVIGELNLGGVWKDIPINHPAIKPNWIIPLRFGMKGVLHLIGQKDKWSQLERNIFYYWLEPYRSYYKNGYKEVFFDRRGQRYYLSWWIEEYLNSHNVNFKKSDFDNNY